MIVATAKVVATGGVAFAAIKEIFHRVESIERRFDNVEQSKGNQYQNMVELNRWFKKMDGDWEILKAFMNSPTRERDQKDTSCHVDWCGYFELLIVCNGRFKSSISDYLFCRSYVSKGPANWFKNLRIQHHRYWTFDKSVW